MNSNGETVWIRIDNPDGNQIAFQSSELTVIGTEENKLYFCLRSVPASQAMTFTSKSPATSPSTISAGRWGSQRHHGGEK